jgi:thiamine biosynthesis lipoprotein
VSFLSGRVRLVDTMGTVVTLDLRTKLAPDAPEPAFQAAERELRAADADFSTWRPDSWISRLAGGRASVSDCPLHVRQLLALAEQFEELTAGYFTSHWRGDGHLDPTGLVKGWAAQQASDALALHGAPDHLVNAAGDIVLSGEPDPPAARANPSWQVGISDPAQLGGLAGVVALPAGGPRWAVASSGRAERGDHILDPRTGAPATAVTSATVVAAESAEWPEPGAVADACATALVAAGNHASVLLRRLRGFGLRGLVRYADGQHYDPDQLLG